MNSFSIRRSVAALALGLGMVAAHAEVTTSLATWQADLGVSLLSSLPTIDFSFNPAGVQTNHWQAPYSGIVAAYNPGVLSFNQTIDTYTQLFFTGGPGNSSLNSTAPTSYGAFAAMSVIANPWGLKVVGGSNPYLDFYGSPASGTSAAVGLQFWSANSAGGFSDGVKAVSFDLSYKSGNFLTQRDSLSSHQIPEEGLLMVTYKNLQTGLTRNDYQEVFNTSSNESPSFNIGAIANLNEVVFQLTYFSCFKHQTGVGVIEWAGCGAQAAVDNIRVVQAVPEPETYALMLAGLGLIGVRAASRRKSAV